MRNKPSVRKKTLFLQPANKKKLLPHHYEYECNSEPVYTLKNLILFKSKNVNYSFEMEFCWVLTIAVLVFQCILLRCTFQMQCI